MFQSAPGGGAGGNQVGADLESGEVVSIRPRRWGRGKRLPVRCSSRSGTVSIRPRRWGRGKRRRATAPRPVQWFQSAPGGGAGGNVAIDVFEAPFLNVSIRPRRWGRGKRPCPNLLGIRRLQAGIRETGRGPGFFPGHEWARLIIKHCTKPPFVDREDPASKPERQVREAHGIPRRRCGVALNSAV